MIQTRIEAMAHGGFGIARIDGIVHFVPETVTEDLVEIEPVTRKKRYIFSRMVRLLEPSPARTDPFCPWYEECGGCQIQHIRYPTQLRIKQEIFLDQMKRIGKFDQVTKPEITGSSAKRLRMRFQIQQGKIGLFQRRSNTLCQMERCPVAEETINRLLQEVRQTLRNLPHREKIEGGLTVLTSAKKVHLAADLSENRARALYRSLPNWVRGCVFFAGKERLTLGEPHLSIPVLGSLILVPADVFWQANPEINNTLVIAVRSFMEGTERVVELFCGCGNFTLPLSRVCGKVVGIEQAPPAVHAAQESASRAGIRNISFHCVNAEEADFDKMDGLVLDPPRPGLSTRLTGKIGKEKPRRIAYISCNPSTLARDLRTLVNFGYTLQSLRLFDMFPHSHHIEALALLTAG